MNGKSIALQCRSRCGSGSSRTEVTKGHRIPYVVPSASPEPTDGGHTLDLSGRKFHIWMRSSRTRNTKIQPVAGTGRLPEAASINPPQNFVSANRTASIARAKSTRRPVFCFFSPRACLTSGGEFGWKSQLSPAWSLTSRRLLATVPARFGEQLRLRFHPASRSWGGGCACRRAAHSILQACNIRAWLGLNHCEQGLLAMRSILASSDPYSAVLIAAHSSN
jgi:hypothetical protein